MNRKIPIPMIVWDHFRKNKMAEEELLNQNIKDNKTCTTTYLPSSNLTLIL